MATTGLGPEPLLADIASHFEDLADPVQFEPWRLIAIDTSRGRSRNRELHHPCYILVDFCAFRSFGLRPQGVIEVVLGQEEFSFPTVLPMAVNVVSLGEFLAPLVAHRPSRSAMAGLAQWRPSGFGLDCMPRRFLPSGTSVVWTNLDAEYVGWRPPLICGTLHIDMDAMPDTSLVRVTIYIPGGNTLISSRELSVTCQRSMMETCALEELRSRFGDLRVVGFRVIPVHPVVTWNAPFLTLKKEKMVLVYEDVVLQLDAVVYLRLHLPPSTGKEPSTALVDSARGSWWHNLASKSPVEGRAGSMYVLCEQC